MTSNADGSKWSKIRASLRSRKNDSSRMRKFRSEPAYTQSPRTSAAPSPKSLSISKQSLFGSKRGLVTQLPQELKSEIADKDANATNITTSPLSGESRAESPETGNTSGNSYTNIDQDHNSAVLPTQAPALEAHEQPTRSLGHEKLQLVVSSLHKTVQANNPIPHIQKLMDSDSNINEQSESTVYKSSTFIVGRFDDVQTSEQVSDAEKKQETTAHEGLESVLPPPERRSIRIEKGRL
eukprot:CAMPEP_0184705594 /NCGR_PEP_ID=MMETSP0313-20130426/34868_1 /TAXON_ID=2792 /ORGANISM="Porphyridium aerugineum, Strain SAG 1380-2" /LENGTH=237 /DNA_ID=CAMNT_0027166973 /DNA_START=81 /DNA_END=794 /DNA_ORIENTATION=+